MRLDPSDRPVTFLMHAFDMHPVTRRFAIGRIRRKLNRAGVDSTGSHDDLLARYEPLVGHLQKVGTLACKEWIDSVEAAVPKPRIRRAGTLLSVVVPCYRTKVEWAKGLVASLHGQSYERWQLILVDDGLGQGDGVAIFAKVASEDARVKLIKLEANLGISGATNAGLAAAEGAWVVLLDHDDELATDALAAIAEAIEYNPDAGWIYTDEDKLDELGERCEPHFKTSYDPLLGLGQHYASHLSAVRRELIDAVGGLREGFEGAQDHDLWLRCTAQLRPEQVVHVPRLCYRWRRVSGSTSADAGAKAGCEEASLRALRERCAELDPGAEVSPGVLPLTYRIRWSLPSGPPLVSVIIPTRNGLDVLRTCLATIGNAAGGIPLELLVVDNGSDDAATLKWLSEWESGGERRRVIRDGGLFNFSRLNNRAAVEATGELLLFCNNDIEFTAPDCIEELVRQGARPGVGAVGARLLYPDRTVQHAGVVLGIGGVAGHGHKNLLAGHGGSFGRALIPRQVSAVTAALMLVPMSCFREVGGFEEELTVAFNDVDLCLRIREAGYDVVWTPYAEAMHHESRSRGAEDNPAKQSRFRGEVEFMIRRWGASLDQDPFYSPHLSRQHDDYSLREAQTYPEGEELAALWAPRPGGIRPRRRDGSTA